MSRFPFSPYPAGWFRVASSDALVPGAVTRVQAFGQALVLFRAASGAPRLMEAHCPHLGAHLGVGGKVEGDAVVCPFHGWRIQGDGAVGAVPYSQKPPPRVCVRTWPLREVNGQVLAWHHPEGAAPTWEPPVLAEATDPAWTGFVPAKSWTIKTHVQELAENGVDNAHFSYLHHQQTKGMRTDDLSGEGAWLVHRTWQQYAVFGLAKYLVDKVEGPLDVHYHGLGIFVNRATVHAGITLEYVFAFYPTPIDEEHVGFHSFLAMKKIAYNPLATWALWQKAVTESGVTIQQDVPIWEYKRYLEKPVLVAEDGPLRKFRAWTRQFYPEVVAQAAK